MTTKHKADVNQVKRNRKSAQKGKVKDELEQPANKRP